MKKVLILIFAFSLSFANAGYCKGSDKVVATVNGEKIYFSEVQRNLNQIPNFNDLPEGQKKAIESKITSALTKLKAVIQEAKKLNVDKTPEYKEKIQDFEQQLLYTTLLENHIKTFITDTKLKEYYNKHKKDYLQDKANASHILVETQKEAEVIIQKLKAGEDFEKLAKENSIGPSANNGGNLGWFSRDSMVEEFSEAAFKLKKAQYSKTPVQTEFGWHVIILKDKETGVPVPFEDVKEDIQQEIAQKEIDKYLTSIINKADIEINENSK